VSASDAVGGTKLTGLLRQDSDISIRYGAAGRSDFDSCHVTTSSGRHRSNGGGVGSGASGVGSNATGGNGGLQRRQVVMRPLGNSGRRQKAARPPSIVGGLGGVSSNQIQLISLPQLDLVQRSLKVLDVRVQRLHTAAVEEDKVGIQSASASKLPWQRSLHNVIQLLGIDLPTSNMRTHGLDAQGPRTLRVQDPELEGPGRLSSGAPNTCIL